VCAHSSIAVGKARGRLFPQQMDSCLLCWLCSLSRKRLCLPRREISHGFAQASRYRLHPPLRSSFAPSILVLGKAPEPGLPHLVQVHSGVSFQESRLHAECNQRRIEPAKFVRSERQAAADAEQQKLPKRPQLQAAQPKARPLLPGVVFPQLPTHLLKLRSSLLNLHPTQRKAHDLEVFAFPHNMKSSKSFSSCRPSAQLSVAA